MAITTSVIRNGKSVTASFFDDTTVIDMTADHTFTVQLCGLEREATAHHARTQTINGTPTCEIQAARPSYPGATPTYQVLSCVGLSDGTPIGYNQAATAASLQLMLGASTNVAFLRVCHYLAIQLDYNYVDATTGAWDFFAITFDFDTEADAGKAAAFYQESGSMVAA